ncbi:chymotrypsin-2-like [Leguminivora glycinivorella]|uniref:chymotrypsin-2-like n=1 Tax=Leguminivora glycinivorella TaxID=1035111 RepID=UPI00200F692A|nr:chymotrypsin-2-like [Leguminivora glycinivorella]
MASQSQYKAVAGPMYNVRIFFIMSIILLVLMAEFVVARIPSKGSLRVYEGEHDVESEFGFTVSLQYTKNKLRFCTGSLLDNNWVITTGHCVENRTPYDMTIRYGDFTLLETDKVAKVFRIIIHPNYSHIHGFNDIAMLMTERIPGKPSVSILALDYKTLFGLPVTFAGFGRTSLELRPKTHDQLLEEQQIPLQVGKGVVIPCQSYESFKYSALCVAPRCRSRQQARSGDAGGPLLYKGRIIGIQRSILTKHNLSITKYIPLSIYVAWIRNIMKTVASPSKTY